MATQKANPIIATALSTMKDLTTGAVGKEMEFHCFSSSDLVFSVSDGSIKARKLGPFEERAIVRRIAQEHTLSLGNIDIVLPFGIVAISGMTKAGKSTFLRAVAQVNQTCQIFPAVEPYDGPEDVVNSFVYRSADNALAAAVAANLSGSAGIVGIDSLRAPLFETTGAAGSKGVIMPFFTALTRVSNSLATAGITALATVNPMDEDKDYQVAFLSKLGAATAGIILLERSSEEGFTGAVEIRDRGSDIHRVARRFSILPGAGRKPATIEPSTVELVPAQPTFRQGAFTPTMISQLESKE